MFSFPVFEKLTKVSVIYKKIMNCFFTDIIPFAQIHLSIGPLFVSTNGTVSFESKGKTTIISSGSDK